jgi:hypothetical protein
MAPPRAVLGQCLLGRTASPIPTAWCGAERRGGGGLPFPRRLLAPGGSAAGVLCGARTEGRGAGRRLGAPADPALAALSSSEARRPPNSCPSTLDNHPARTPTPQTLPLSGGTPSPHTARRAAASPPRGASARGWPWLRSCCPRAPPRSPPRFTASTRAGARSRSLPHRRRGLILVAIGPGRAAAFATGAPNLLSESVCLFWIV